MAKSRSRQDMNAEELKALRESDRVKKQAERQRERSEKAAADLAGKTISEVWSLNESKLNRALRAKLQERHEFVTDLEAIADSEDALDLCFRDIKTDIDGNGVLNYMEIMAPEYVAVPDSPADFYKRIGVHLCFGNDTLQDVRERLVISALSTESKFDTVIVEEAINDCLAFNGFSPNKQRLEKLIRAHRNIPAPPPQFVTMTASDGYSASVPFKIAEEYKTKNIPFRSPAQLEALAGAYQRLAAHGNTRYDYQGLPTGLTEFDLKQSAEKLAGLRSYE